MFQKPNTFYTLTKCYQANSITIYVGDAPISALILWYSQLFNKFRC